MNNHFVIVTPSYNNEDWIDVYFDSIIEQSYQNYHVIYINDCSTDNTHNLITKHIGNKKQFTYIRNPNNIGAAANYAIGFDMCKDDDIIVNLDGDDWITTNNVLERLNEAYNQHDYWITYGKMMVYDGTDNLVEANPQNTSYDPFVHKHQFYRRDMWRASHMRTFRKFLYDKIDPSDLTSKIDEKLYWHAHDLSLMYPMMEMTPIEKIGVITFPTYVYNNSKPNNLRTRKREDGKNVVYEEEIRAKKIYIRVKNREDLKRGVRLPQINMFGDYKERNSIPTKFSFVYNRTWGEFDITLFQDDEILKYLDGLYKISHGKIIADVHEPPYLFEQSKVYQRVLSSADKFDRIITCSKDLLHLSNAKYRNSGYEVVLNKNIHKQMYPLLQDDSLMKIYPKSKNISFITSAKTFSEGHRFRLKCVEYLLSKGARVDLYGVGIHEIEGKIEALKDYKFSISMENGVYPNYYSEKILDCFLTGTVPIYHGCPNILDFFDKDGIILFNTMEELLEIVNSLTPDDYIKRMSAVENNYKLADAMWMDNDKFFSRYLEDLLSSKT